MGDWRFCRQCHQARSCVVYQQHFAGESYTRLTCAACGAFLEEWVSTTANTPYVWRPDRDG